MRMNDFRNTLRAAVLGITIFLLAVGLSYGQQTVNLTAQSTTVALPDGSVVPMWGYACGAAAIGSTATCANLNPNAPAAVAATNATPAIPAGWSPVVITVPYVATGTSLTIHLTNTLSFTPAGSTTANNIPTSLVIVGQVGGGLGSVGAGCTGGGTTCTPSPTHAAQTNATWPIATTAATPFNPPVQGPRAQSFATEVAAGTTAALTWPLLKPGTYLLESGTHPSIQVPMGLYGILVVTDAPASAGGTGTAYPGVAATATVPGIPPVTYNAEIPLEFSEIDPVQNNAVQAAVNTVGFSETMVWSDSAAVVSPGVPATPGCGNPSSPSYHQCYPPAVNYTPLYYLINGVPFNKTNAGVSLFPVSPASGVTAGTGTVLVRMVNAGLRMHVPSIVGAQTTGWRVSTTTSTTTATTGTVPGFTLIAEDGNPVPGPLAMTTGTSPAPHVQSDVFMAAGKTFDVMINAPATGTKALPVFDRELSLSGNSSLRDAGMLAYISVNGATLPAASEIAAATVSAMTYNSIVTCAAAPCIPVVVSDPSKGLLANDTNANGVQLLTGPTGGTLTLNANGTFTYVPNAGTTSDSFTVCVNGTVTAGVCSSGTTESVSLGAATMEAASAILMNPITYTAKTATYVSIPPPGVLSVDKDPAGYSLKVDVSTVAASGVTVTMEPNGGFVASAPGPGTYHFSYKAQNSQGTDSSTAPTVTLVFPSPSNLAVTVKDPKNNITLTDYRWIIEEDKTFYINPNCTTTATSTTPAPGCPTFGSTTGGPSVPPTFGVNFHTSHMDYVTQGCTGGYPGIGSSSDLSCEEGQTLLGTPVACDAGNGVCDTTRSQQTPVLPSQVVLDPGCGFGTHTVGTPGCTQAAPYPKRYYISVLPGDAANPFAAGYAGNPAACTSGSGGATTCGHSMGGASITWNTATNSWNPVTVLTEPSPYPPGKVSVQVFEDDFPLNGEQDAGGGIDVIATNEQGLGGFNIVLWDVRAQFGDATGQMTYDMFNQPLSNSLAGTVDPATGFDACPISPEISANATTPGPNQGQIQGQTGMIVTCPKYESDGKTLSPLAGEAVIANVMPMQLTVQAYPGADRIARAEEWIQTNTLDGQHPHDAFVKIGEPAYFQEYGPAGFHVSIGFANPKIINARYAGVCGGTDLNLTANNCTNTVTGKVTDERISRTPDQRLYSSGSRDAFYWTQCWASLGDPDGEDFMFTKCDADGNFTFTGVPSGDWRITTGDQWNDQIIDGLSTPIGVGSAANQTINMGDIPVQQWQSNVYTRTFMDDNKDGLYQSTELGIPLLNTTVRYRDGSMANNLLTDFTGVANFNETFPLFNWYAVEADTTRYKTTGIHTVYDAGGPADGSTSCGSGSNGNPLCGTSTSYLGLANTYENLPLPGDLSVPGAVYCSSADCTGSSIASAVAVPSSTSNHSTGRIDPPWVLAEGWQGQIGQGNFIEFGKAPYAPNENGGIKGHVIYASTRPFDDPQMNVQQPWEPLVPHVTINLYQEGFAADGVTPTLTLVDTTQSSSWDDWAQGFRSDGKPNINCPGQGAATGANADVFFYTLYNQPNYLNLYNYYFNGGTLTNLPYNSQYKCYDGMHNWNQLQPVYYDGAYSFPSVLGINPSTGKLNTTLTGGVGTPGASSFTAANMRGTNCTICMANPDTTDLWRVGTPMLPPGKYIVEVVPPPGYEIVKEEDKNILIGDNFIAPVNQQFGALGDVFIIPDQASVASLYDPSGSGPNPNNAQNPTQSLGAEPNSQIVPGFVEPVWPCAGQLRTVPDYMSIFPQAHEVAAFAGASRHLCDRKEVTLTNQMGAIAKFYIFTSTHIASKYTGVITDDFTSEFDPFAPTFGEKFSPPNMPVSTRDWAGYEISRVYTDQWGVFDGLSYSTWEVNPPNPTGYSPTMMVQCMNDAGPVLDTRPTITTWSGSTLVTVANPNYNKVVTDPLFNPLYSQFCYENPYMPGTTGYLDTPVVPTAGFVGAGYNNPDCAYPTLTPAISEVDGDGIGPYVGAAGHVLSIYALGDQAVNNYGYSGPASTTVPYNQKTVTRHYGFGSCTRSPFGVCTNGASVTVGGVRAGILSWTDTMIRVVAPAGVPTCAVQQQAQYAPGATTALCGELVITAANGQQSVDTVTVTIGGKAPTHVPATGSIQAAIDAAAPGDLIMLDPTTQATATAAAVPAVHRELLLMWKPVRLQGIGAASSIIDASTHPAGTLKLDPWRASVNCLFGLALNGQPNTGANSFDPTGRYSCPTPSSPTASGTGPDGNTWNYFYGGPNYPTMVVDRIPLEGILGWDATVNGNLAEQLQEPSLMGAYEGAAISVLAKGVNIPASSTDVFGSGAEAAFPTGTTLLTGAVTPSGTGILGDLNPLCHTSNASAANPFPSNFMCNPSRIDGLTITDASQGGGGIFVHAWGHNLQIANNRITNNAGTLSGGMSIGQGEFPEAYLNGTANDSDPGSCFTPLAGQTTTPLFPLNTQLPYCLNLNVNMHHNSVTYNSSTGDELFSGTPAGAGGVSIGTGDDFYHFTNNWVCGNMSTGDGGGVGHLGFSWNGDIEHNQFLFNQSTNPSIQSNGGGLIVMGAAPDGLTLVNGVITECGSVTDNDCVPGLSDGTGPGLVINGNLFQGNGAEAGSGGGLRLQSVNGADIARFISPGPCTSQADCQWYVASVTNNTIVNNVAGWDGAGISLEDSLVVKIVNNTVASNDTTASSGNLFNTLGAPLASSQSPAPTCIVNGLTTSCPQPAGLVTMQNSPQLTSSFTTGTIQCPAGHFQPGTSPNNGTCIQVSYPVLDRDIFWQNRDFHVSVGSLGTGTQNQQNVVTLNPTLNQTSIGACPTTTNYWDIGVRNDTGPTNHGSNVTLNPTGSILTSTAGYPGTTSNPPGFPQQYCNGSRVPPENGGLGYQVPPGIADAVVPNPIFSLQPTATVDEGNNWINMSWGPLSLVNPVTGVFLGNYTLGPGGPGAH